jgi:membrane glycosyltransferase
MAVLLMPKFFGLALALADAKLREQCGGARRIGVSATIEIFFSALLAPIMMVIQTGAVIRILMGIDSGWNPQRRDDGSVPLGTVLLGHLLHMLLGFVTLVAGLLISPSLVAWMSPTIAGLMFAALLTWGSAQRSIGLALRRKGLLLTPEETSPPPLIGEAARWRDDLVPAAVPDMDWLRILHRDPELREWHTRFLLAPVERRRGDIDESRVTASAKLDEAQSIDEAIAWLKPAERVAVLLDRALIARLAALP